MGHSCRNRLHAVANVSRGNIHHKLVYCPSCFCAVKSLPTNKHCKSQDQGREHGVCSIMGLPVSQLHLRDGSLYMTVGAGKHLSITW